MFIINEPRRVKKQIPISSKSKFLSLTGPTHAVTYENDEKPKGSIMLQGDHGPVSYRNLQLKRVKLRSTKTSHHPVKETTLPSVPESRMIGVIIGRADGHLFKAAPPNMTIEEHDVAARRALPVHM
jgi:hypothetical protein